MAANIVVKMETIDQDEPEIMEIPAEPDPVEEPEKVAVMKKLLEGTITSMSSKHLQKAIEYFNGVLADKMETFLEIGDIYHYFCIITETAIDDPNLKALTPSLNVFYQRVIQLCYQWKCLSEDFGNDYRFLNFIQLIIQKVIDRLKGSISSDNNVINHSIPLMLTSMLITVSTFHGLKEVVIICKPIYEIIVRKKSDLSLNTEEWKQLIFTLSYVTNAWKQIFDIDGNDEKSLRQFTLYYLDLYLGSNTFLSHISDKAIKCLGKEKNIEFLEELFIEFQYDVSRYVLGMIEMNSNFDGLETLLQKTMSFFGVNSLPSELLKHIIPHFAVKCDPTTDLFIKQVSIIDDIRVSDVIKAYLPDIMRHMFYSKRFDSFEDFEKVIKYLSELSDSHILYRIKYCSYELVNCFLTQSSKDFETTLKAIAFVQYVRTLSDVKTPELVNKYRNLSYYQNNESELKKDLKEFFLGFVHKFDNLMQDNSICIEDKMVAIRSFVLLIESMDRECINTFRVKLFSTIKLIISEKFYSNKDLIKLSIKSMEAFVKRVDEKFLCSQLLTMSALVLPLMHFWPTDSADIFKELIIKHKTNPFFESSFKHLYFIPEMNELREVTEVLKPYITCGDTEEEICQKISLVVNNLNHENNGVQQFSLQELVKLLEKHLKLIYKKCNNIKELDFDDFVNHIISQLMVCLKSTNKNVLLLAAECLGILGAIDPMRVDLEKVVISKEENIEKFLNFSEKKFKVILINRLYRAITTATTTEDQYCASYALQEVVKIFTGVNSSDGFKLEDLSQELQDFCQLLKRTQYHTKLPAPSSEVPLKVKPIFMSSETHITYEEWLNAWISRLFEFFIFKDKDKEDAEYNAIYSLSQNAGPDNDLSFELNFAQTLVNHSIKSKVLISCYQILLRNKSIAEFLLPYIVITGLRNATPDQKQQIIDEIQIIIQTLIAPDFVFNDNMGHSICQTVFHIYDYLKIWHKKRIVLHKRQCQRGSQLRVARRKDREFKGVLHFLQGISTRELSRLAFKCNAFARSLRYIEEFIKLNENELQEEIPFFQKLFIRLDEPDSVEGINSKRCPNNPTIHEMILTNEAMGQMQEALMCCEKAIALNPNDFECQQKYLQISMDSFDQSAMVKTYGSGLILSRPDWSPKLAPYVIEAVWRLGDWKRLDRYLEEFNVHALNSFGAGIGDLFCSMIKKKDLNDFEDIVRKLLSTLIDPLKAAATEISGYVRGHKYIVDLHILRDIYHIYNKLFTELNEDICSIEILTNKFNEVIDIWDQRIGLVRETIKCQEPILNAQRAMFAILSNRSSELSPSIKREVFKSWLKSTKTARKSGNIQRSYNCLLEMDKLRKLIPLGERGSGCLTDIENCEAIIESAKIQWNKNNKIAAIQYLKSEIENNYMSSLEYSFRKAVNSLSERFTSEELNEIRNSLSFGSSLNGYTQGTNVLQNLSDSSDNNEEQPSKGFAKLQLLYAKYCDRSGVLDQNALAVLFRSVRAAAPDWEESHYHLAMYCNKILINYEESKRNNKSFSLGKPEEILEMKGRIVQSLVESLKYGVKNAHNSLPLMLNIWFDLGTDSVTNTKLKSSIMSEEIRKIVEKMNNAIKCLVANVPLFIFFPSFAQMAGRVLHPCGGITLILKRILIKMIRMFPQQSMWLMMRSIHSQNLNRKNTFKEILNQAVNEEKSLNKFINDMLRFAKHMTNLCQKGSNENRIRNNQKVIKDLSLRRDFPELSKLLDPNSGFSEILLPFGLLVNVTLPESFYKTDFNPFPSKSVYIRGIDDSIDLLHSLQRPKKIKIKGTDGKTYTILCKSGDDLRKDYCLIEFCNLLNRCFKRDADSRRRQLKVKTYLVISLTDNCGLIEWIPGLIPFRTLVEQQYRLNVDYDSLRDTVLKNYPQASHYSHSERIRLFQSDILPKFKPCVLGNWFASTYTDPLSWFSARQTFARTSAVFSIVGYLLGLGDRHGENILIEEMTGQTVHVDLNCMFNKGEEFQVPERVPFRLTQNMIHAMGVTEYEGTFRKACEHVLRVSRDNKEALLNFVNPFRFDHLVEWSKTNSQIKSSASEATLEQAERIVFNIEARLKGIPSRNERNLPKGIPLSVEGQVDHIIKESTDVNNLGLMYVGWGAYL